jgi:hypothetical protein
MYSVVLLAAFEKKGVRFVGRALLPVTDCRTDLERLYPKHVCNRWLDHGSAVAERHYLMDTDEEWTRAARVDDFQPRVAPIL